MIKMLSHTHTLLGDDENYDDDDDDDDDAVMHS